MMIMRRMAPVTVAAVLGALALGACSSSSSSSSSTSGSTTTAAALGGKAAFCGDNATLDMAFLSVQDAASAVAAVRANQATINDFDKQAPADIKAQADVLFNASNAAVAANDGTKFETPEAQAAGNAVNTYCGQLADGSPMPSDAGAGKGTTFCADQATLDQAVQGATDAASLLAALKADQTKIDEFAANIPASASISADAQALVTTARAAITANDASSIQTPAVASHALRVDSYCGISASSSSSSTTAPPTTA